MKDEGCETKCPDCNTQMELWQVDGLEPIWKCPKCRLEMEVEYEENE